MGVSSIGTYGLSAADIYTLAKKAAKTKTALADASTDGNASYAAKQNGTSGEVLAYAQIGSASNIATDSTGNALKGQRVNILV